MSSSQCPPPGNSSEIEDLYPPGSSPENRTDDESALCAYEQSQILMTGSLREILIAHFSDLNNILSPHLRRRFTSQGLWKDDANARPGITIESLHRWRPELAEASPALVLKAHEWQFQRLVIGDVESEDHRNGRFQYFGTWVGAHTIFVLANEAEEAQIVANEVMKKLVWFSTHIAQSLNLLRFLPVSIGEVGALAESREHYVVPVVVGYVAEESWWLQEEAPRTKRFVFNANTGADEQ